MFWLNGDQANIHCIVETLEVSHAAMFWLNLDLSEYSSLLPIENICSIVETLEVSHEAMFWLNGAL